MEITFQKGSENVKSLSTRFGSLNMVDESHDENGNLILQFTYDENVVNGIISDIENHNIGDVKVSKVYASIDDNDSDITTVKEEILHDFGNPPIQSEEPTNNSSGHMEEDDDFKQWSPFDKMNHDYTDEDEDREEDVEDEESVTSRFDFSDDTDSDHIKNEVDSHDVEDYNNKIDNNYNNNGHEIDAKHNSEQSNVEDLLKVDDEREISELVPTSQLLYEKVNQPIHIDDKYQPATPMVLLLKNMYENPYETRDLIMGDKLESLSQGEFDSELEQLRNNISVNRTQEMSNYLKLLHKKSDICLNTIRHTELIKKSYNDKMEEWVANQLDSLRRLYKEQNPDNTELEVVNYVNELKPELDQLDLDIIEAKQKASQSILHRLVSNAKNSNDEKSQSLVKILAFIDSKERSQQRFNQAVESMYLSGGLSTNNGMSNLQGYSHEVNSKHDADLEPQHTEYHHVGSQHVESQSVEETFDEHENVANTNLHVDNADLPYSQNEMSDLDSDYEGLMATSHNETSELHYTKSEHTEPAKLEHTEPMESEHTESAELESYETHNALSNEDTGQLSTEDQARAELNKQIPVFNEIDNVDVENDHDDLLDNLDELKDYDVDDSDIDKDEYHDAENDTEYDSHDDEYDEDEDEEENEEENEEEDSEFDDDDEIETVSKKSNSSKKSKKFKKSKKSSSKKDKIIAGVGAVGIVAVSAGLGYAGYSYFTKDSSTPNANAPQKQESTKNITSVAGIQLGQTVTLNVPNEGLVKVKIVKFDDDGNATAKKVDSNDDVPFIIKKEKLEELAKKSELEKQSDKDDTTNTTKTTDASDKTTDASDKTNS